jgi:hypothetical protein
MREFVDQRGQLFLRIKVLAQRDQVTEASSMDALGQIGAHDPGATSPQVKLKRSDVIREDCRHHFTAPCRFREVTSISRYAPIGLQAEAQAV